MFSGIGGMEIVVILVVALMVLGPDHLPRLMRLFGRAMGEVRKASTEFQRTLNTDLAVREKAAETPAAETPATAPRTVQPLQPAPRSTPRPAPRIGIKKRPRRPDATRSGDA